MPTIDNVLTLYRGDSGYIDILIKQEDGVSPLDLTDVEVRLTVKKNFDDTDEEALFFVTTKDDGVLIAEALQGKCRAVIDGTHTRDLKDGEYHYDVKVVWTDGIRTRRKTVINAMLIVLDTVWRGELV